MRNEANYSIRKWVNNLPKIGRITFSLQEIRENFPDLNTYSIARNLTRLASAGIIQSLHKGFYIVVPAEYALKGIVPPVVYINQLMEFLNRKYYIGLLDAAAFYAAAHQRPQEFTVIITLPAMRSTSKKGITINYKIKKTINIDLCRQMKTKTGYVYVSSPELTAFDLVSFQAEIGGINRVVAILFELCEELNFERLDVQFLKTIPKSVIQRLGYLLEFGLEQFEAANKLFSTSQNAGIKFRKTVLKTGKYLDNCEFNDKWQIFINEVIDI